MEFKALFNIRYLLLQDIDPFITPKFNITNDTSKKDGLLDQKFKSLSGMRSNQSFERNTIAYRVYREDHNSPAFISKMDRTFNDLTKQIRAFLTFLWFIKDNSISVEEAFGIFANEEKSKWWTDHTVYSTCDGKFRNTAFTSNEMAKAIDLLFAYVNICPETADTKKSDFLGELTSASSHMGPGLDPYCQQNRIERALTFLNTARSSPHLPQKITHYMSILECLFSADANEVVHKVSERTAYFVGENKADRITIFKVIKGAYDVRSKFVHGQKIKQQPDPLRNISIKVDDITRRVLTKIILSEHVIFLEKDEHLAKYLNEIIF